MTRPIISVVGNLGNYRINIPTLSKIIGGGTFTAPLSEQLKAGSTPQMPIPNSSNAPYVFSLILNGGAANNTDGFAMNSMAITVYDSAGQHVRTTHHHAHSDIARAARAQAEEGEK